MIGVFRIDTRSVVDDPHHEAAVALAIVLNFYNNHLTVDVDNAEELKG